MTKLCKVWFAVINVMLLINPKMPIAEVIANGDDDNSDNGNSTFWLVIVVIILLLIAWSETSGSSLSYTITTSQLKLPQ
jgi:hypothetical protein